MRTPAAAIGSTAFFLGVPAVVGGVVPGLLTGWWDRAAGALGGPYVAAVGVALVCAGATVMVGSFVRFVTEGLGTPAPIAPAERLVVGGLYRHVRNPMYVAVLAAIVGQAVLLQRPVLWLYALGVTVAVVAFVRRYEEPTLRRRFGEQYEVYRRAVPAWIPRIRPWDANTATD